MMRMRAINAIAAVGPWLAGTALSAGEAVVDADNAVWVLRLERLIPSPIGRAGDERDLDLHLVRREGRFLHGLGWSLPRQVARPFNTMTHQADASGLGLADGKLSGQLDVTLHPDLWIPRDYRPMRGRVALEGKADAAASGRGDAVRGTFTADFAGRKTRGAFAGGCRPLEPIDMGDFSTRLTVYNGWINDYPPIAKRLVLGLDFRKGRAVAVKLGVLGVWGNYHQITHLGEAPGATADVTATRWGFEGEVCLTAPQYTAPADAPPARYRFDLKVVGVQEKLCGTIQARLERGGKVDTQAGWLAGACEPPWVAPQEKQAGPQPTCTVEAELVEKCAQPTPREMAPYVEAVGVYVYRVLKVAEGKCGDPKIAVTHWVTKRLLAQPITTHKPGERMTLRLCPLEAVSKDIQTVFRKEPAGALDLPQFFDCAQKLVYPEGAANRWSYNVELSPKFPLMFRLKDQLKLVTLGDCQAWYANRAELFMGEANRTTPMALNLCQKRSGIPFQKLMIETYLIRLPRLEWIVVTWNPRWLTGTWAEHGVKARELANSPGFRYDVQHLDEVLKPEDRPPETVEDIASSRFARLWRSEPWGWNRQGEGPSGNRGHAELVGYQQRLGTFSFVPQRWAEFESVVKKVVETSKARLLVYTQVIHPASAKMRVKDKLGTDAEHYRFQVSLMRGLEKRYPGRFFFYDLNNMGDNGLESGDFRDSDHVSGRGARRVSEKVEKFRLECEAKLAARTGGKDP